MSSQPSGELPTVPQRSPAATVGDYTLLSRIGEGGMGVVHLARRPGGERVALKMLRPHIVGDDEARARLAREVGSLQRIRSRWIAEIVDADPWAPIPYVATRYVPGLSLHDQVKQDGPVEERDLLWFAGCLAEGLASVHAAGVLHRDVKPSNVLMEGRTPILIDFGLARVADDPRLTHTGWLLGTPGYLAPEILYGENATAASDLHAWGATVAFAATGVSPFGRGPAMAIMDRVRRGEHDLSAMSGPLRDVVEAVLAPDAAQRPSLDAVLAWLRPQTTDPQPLLAAPPTSPEDPEDPEDPDLFTVPLAIAALAHAPRDADRGTGPDPDEVFDGQLDGQPGGADAPTVAERATDTRVLPVQDAPPMSPPVHHPAYRAPEPSLPPPYEPAPVPVQQQVYPDFGPVPLPPQLPERTPLAERLRRGALVVAGCVLVGAAVAAAPYVTAVVLLVAVWLVRSASLAASAVGFRRQRRGRRWYDGVQYLLNAPWHLVQSIPGTVLLVLWGAGLGVATALVCYAVAAGVPTTLFASGVVLAGSLWWGPGGGRVRSPLARLVDPASRSTGVWLVAVVVVLLLALLLGLRVEGVGVWWEPAGGRPFAGARDAFGLRG